MLLPAGVSDPYSQHELALKLGMTVSELIHGRGTPPSAYELTVAWPCFFETQARIEDELMKQSEASR